MAKVEKFEDLVIWQRARELTKEIYKITSLEPFNKDTRFVQQIHAASGSIMDNIAEGFERDGNKEFLNFLFFAKGSCGEVRSQITRAYDVGFINEEKYKVLYSEVFAINQMISKLITVMKSSGFKGSKHITPQTNFQIHQKPSL